MPNTSRVNEIISQIQGLLVELQHEAGSVTAATAAPPTPEPSQLNMLSEDLGNFDSLRKALMSDRWPEAVNPTLICDPNSEQDKIERGRGIVELMVEEDLNGLKFLDFGCGEGHCADMAAEQNTAVSVGYDLRSFPAWEAMAAKRNGTLTFTTDFAQVQAAGPYDIVILFDVLDHLTAEDPVTVLKKVRSVLSDKGKVYMRCHPFTSRHATHLYHTLNKAFVHLVFSPEELQQIAPEAPFQEKNIGVVTPIKTYGEFVEAAGLTVESRRDITEKVEPFFKIPRIAERIIRNSKSRQYPEFQMSLQFLDFVLKKKK